MLVSLKRQSIVSVSSYYKVLSTSKRSNEVFTHTCEPNKLFNLQLSCHDPVHLDKRSATLLCFPSTCMYCMSISANAAKYHIFV